MQTGRLSMRGVSNNAVYRRSENQISPTRIALRQGAAAANENGMSQIL